MIRVDGPPEEWAGDVARLLVERGADEDELRQFFETVYAP